jgi:general secretion pathway protein A
LGKRVVVVIDEAQNLDDSVLELVRMLSNFETSREKLIQIILSGQPQLAEKIGSPELVQLRQRVSIFACLNPSLRKRRRST